MVITQVAYANPKVRGSNPGLDRLRVKTRLSTLGTSDVPRGSAST